VCCTVLVCCTGLVCCSVLHQRTVNMHVVCGVMCCSVQVVVVCHISVPWIPFILCVLGRCVAGCYISDESRPSSVYACV